MEVGQCCSVCWGCSAAVSVGRCSATGGPVAAGARGLPVLGVLAQVRRAAPAFAASEVVASEGGGGSGFRHLHQGDRAGVVSC